MNVSRSPHRVFVPVFIGIGLLTPVAFVVGTTLMGRIEPVRLKEA